MIKLCSGVLRLFVALGAIFLAVSNAVAQPVTASSVPGEVLIRVTDGFAAPFSSAAKGASSGLSLPEVLQKHSASAVISLTGPAVTGKGARAGAGTAVEAPGIYRLSFASDADVSAIMDELRTIPGIVSAEPNLLGSLSYVPSSEPLYTTNQQAAFSVIALENAWQAQINSGLSAGASSNVVVAVIDSGVEATHPDLAPALDLANSWNFVAGNNNITDDLGHGTRVAGIIAAAKNNYGMAGVAFGCRFLSLDVADSSGVITLANVISALGYARTRGAHVANMSFQFQGYSELLKFTCNQAAAEGMVLVASAGNSNQGDRPAYPASFSSVLGVGALDGNGQARASFSNYNGVQRNLVDLFAPGTTLFSTVPGAQFNGTYGSGTSFAAPVVSGVAALLKSVYPAQSGGAIASHLKATAVAPGPFFAPAVGAGFGILHAGNALQLPMQPSISVQSIVVDDSPALSAGNNGNGTLDKGETVRLRLVLLNSGADAQPLTGTLSSASPLLTISDDGAVWDAMPEGQSRTATDTFEVTLSSSALAGNVDLDLQLADAAGTPFSVLSFNLSVSNEETVAAGTNYTNPVTWTSDKTWIVEGQLNVLSDLTIEPGTTVRLKESGRIDVLGGNFSAEGTAGAPIQFHPYATDPLPGYVQDDLMWGAQAAGTGDDFYAATAVCPDGRVVVAGRHQSTVTLEAGNLVPSSGSPRILIASYNPDGTLAWYDSLPCTGNSNSDPEATGVASFSDGHTVVCGRFAGSMTFGAGGANATTLVSANSPLQNAGTDIFFARYDAAGNLIWAKQAGSSLVPAAYERVDIAMGVSVFADGSFAACGFFAGNAVFGPGEPGQRNLNTAAVSLFVARYNSDGTLAWVKDVDNFPTGQTSRVKALSDGTVAVAGSFNGNVTFGPAEPNQTQLVSIGSGPDIFIARFSGADGSVIWAKRAGGDQPDSAFGLDESTDGNLLVTGIFRTICTFDTGITLTASGAVFFADAFLAKYNTGDGSAIWAKRAGGTANDFAQGVVALSDGGCAVVGAFRTSAVFGPGEAGATTLISAGSEDMFFARYHADGTLAFVTRGGGVGVDFFPTGAIAAGDDDSIYIAGKFSAVATFGQGEEGAVQFVSAGAADPIVLRYAGRIGWNGLVIRNSAQSAVLSHCNFNRGTVVNELAGAVINNSRFDYSPGDGLRSTAGTLAVSDCQATRNRFAGLNLGGRPGENSSAALNREGGIVSSASLTSCTATANYHNGLSAVGVTGSRAESNQRLGIVSAGTVNDSVARQNGTGGIVCTSGDVLDSVAEVNTGRGITLSGGGTINGCVARQNTQGGISTNGSVVQNSTVKDNNGTGVIGSGSSSLTGCTISGNSGAAVSGVTTVLQCAVTGNGSGVSGVGTITQSYVAGNTGIGITNGAVSDSVVLGNTGMGVSTNGTVSNSWVVANKGIGIDGGNAGSVNTSTITGNAGGGARNMGSGGLTFSNLYGNSVFDAGDNQTRSTTSTKTFKNNYWGPALTLWMNDNPFFAGIDRDPEILDGADGANGWFLDYTPHATVPVPNAPGPGAPAFLLSATPDLKNAVSVGPTTFTLVFSRDMDTLVHPAVTFGVGAYVVAPDPGWGDARTWQGTFAIQSDTGDGTQTLRVSNATDSTGFVIPDDLRHQFVISSGIPGANNGLVIGTSTQAISIGWEENGKPDITLGYNIRRAQVDSGSGALLTEYERINTETVLTNSYTDSTVTANQIYKYIVDLVDTSLHSIQWIPALTAKAECETGDCTAVEDWMMY